MVQCPRGDQRHARALACTPLAEAAELLVSRPVEILVDPQPSSTSPSRSASATRVAGSFCGPKVATYLAWPGVRDHHPTSGDGLHNSSPCSRVSHDVLRIPLVFPSSCPSVCSYQTRKKAVRCRCAHLYPSFLSKSFFTVDRPSWRNNLSMSLRAMSRQSTSMRWMRPTSSRYVAARIKIKALTD